ncbi:MAG: sulfate adenylyltransferase [Gammaproteobacteria bacterium]|nr:sulfate adenylyltransferase [Gammaproteobacteria bacterium]NIR83320.1 sulfate adenylyltransferase [Gammaproteobacteria bacterium]NIR91120.1 sulfate adenylyltransferase [Gammaproteobacteria bacterium]NIU04487.1 sulfate adenylyltransferase [Gammaproteobacteria bacterium]NIW87123.1 sulfate adenylyltransferase [Gammaproteobacteria bacterium]
MARLVKPHGADSLTPRMRAGEALTTERARAASLPTVRLSSREKGDLIMLGIGGFTPLEGFMSYDDWRGVCDDMRTAGDLFWPIPITLSTDADTAAGLREGMEVALVDSEHDELMGILTLREKYRVDKTHECIEVFRTTDSDHPGVDMVMRQGEVNLAGPVKVLSAGEFPSKYPDLFLTPRETRELFEAKGWSTVAAFQTRNPMHRSHEYLTKTAIEVCDGVLVHSLLGKVKSGDIPAEVRARAIEALIENYFVQHTVVQAGYPLDMRYAGPREALLHAVFRQNYGCSHLIVGRDHAGVGDYYGPFDAHRIFDEIPQGVIETRPLKMDWTFWCNACAGMASMKTCPHTHDDRVLLSGSKLRKLLAEDEPVPENFSRPEVLDILRAYYKGLAPEQRADVTVAGHSAARAARSARDAG